MKRIPFGVAIAAFAVLLPTLAFAQAVGTNFVSETSSSNSSIYTPGTQNAVFGTVTLTGTQPGSVEISSLPIAVSTSNGSPVSNLSDCRILNSGGTVLNTGVNAWNTPSGGTDIVTFDNPLSINQNTSTTLTFECNISSTATSGTSYNFSIGSPNLSSALGVALTTFPSIFPGETNAPIAAVTLSPGTSGDNINVSSIPLMLSFSNNLTPGDLSSCHFSNNGTSLTSGGTLATGTNIFPFNSVLNLAAGSGGLPLIFSCNISAAAPVGGLVSLSITPSQLPSTDASTGAAFPAGTTIDPSTGAVSPLSGTVSIATPTGTVGTVTSPNTGGDIPMTYAFLALALVALISAFAVYKKNERAA